MREVCLKCVHGVSIGILRGGWKMSSVVLGTVNINWMYLRAKSTEITHQYSEVVLQAAVTEGER